VYLKSIGFSVLLIGILEGVAEATAGLSKGYFGHLSDVWRKRVPFVRAGYLLSAFSKPMIALFTYPLWIFFARTLDRFGKGIRTSARDAMLSDETTREHKGKVFGFHRSMDTVGAAIGPVLALVYLYFFPGQYKWMFFIAFFPGLIAVALTFLLKDKVKEVKTPKVLQSQSHKVTKPDDILINSQTHETISPSAKIGFFSYLKYWRKATPAFRLLVAGLLVFTLFNSSDVFLLLALKEQKMSDTLMIGIYIFYNLVYAMFSYPIGVLADKVGLKTMLITGLLLFAIVYSCMGFAGSLFIFGILFFLYGIYAAATEGISKALLSNLADPSETATAIGFYNSLGSICTLAASSLAGILWFSVGPKAMFLISGSGVFLVVVYLAFVFSYKKV
ncbi:MAG: MFS transporter, partial [Bacteroidota bacterium]